MNANLIEDAKRGGYISEIMRRLIKEESVSRYLLSLVTGPGRQTLSADTTYYVRDEVGSCTISNASPAVVTAVGHGLQDDDPVVFRSSGSLPTGLTAGTVYYVNYVDADTFQVAAAPDGTSINTTSAGSGTHYVATGNDDNDGSAADRAHAWLTIQHALDVVAALDLGIYDATIQLASSHYATGLTITGPWVGVGTVYLTGDTATPTNCRQVGSIALTDGARLTVQGLYFTGATRAIDAQRFCAVRCGYCTFAGSGQRFFISDESSLTMIGPTEASGNCTAHYWIVTNSVARIGGAANTLTLTGVPNYTIEFIAVSSNSSVNAVSASYVGAATGKRYDVNLNGTLNTNGGGAAFFPGDVAGTTATGGQYL